MKTMAHPNLDSRIRVTNFPSGDQFNTLGESFSWPLFRLHYSAPSINVTIRFGGLERIPGQPDYALIVSYGNG